MPRKMTRRTAEERRAAATPSGPILPLEDPPKAVVAPDDGGVATRAAWSEPGQEGAAVLESEDHGTTGSLALAVVVKPAPETVPSGYEVIHAAVGGHYKGERVEAGTFTAEQSGRLLTAGAIIPLYKAD